MSLFLKGVVYLEVQRANAYVRIILTQLKKITGEKRVFTEKMPLKIGLSANLLRYFLK